MTMLVFIGADGARHEVDAADGISVMRAAIDGGIAGILGECGGNCSCATCHVYVDPAWLGRISAARGDEQMTLECVLEPRGNSRLGCQIQVDKALEGLVLRLPERQI